MLQAGKSSSHFMSALELSDVPKKPPYVRKALLKINDYCVNLLRHLGM